MTQEAQNPKQYLRGRAKLGSACAGWSWETPETAKQQKGLSGLEVGSQRQRGRP